MTSYSTLDDAFNQHEYDKLHKMAKKVNNKKKQDTHDKYTENKFQYFSAQGELKFDDAEFSDISGNVPNCISDISVSEIMTHRSRDSFIDILNDKTKINIENKEHIKEKEIEHISTCTVCQRKIQMLLTQYPKTSIVENFGDIGEQKDFESNNILEIDFKNILLVILIGILVIIILDIFMKKY